jgi:hypothetical protein
MFRFLSVFAFLLLCAIPADSGCGKGLFAGIRERRDARIQDRQDRIAMRGSASMTYTRTMTYQRSVNACANGSCSTSTVVVQPMKGCASGSCSVPAAPK